MMSLFRRRSNAAPGPVTNNGLTLNQANAALTNALHKVANVKLRNALKAAKNVANASAANKNARIKELEKALAEAKPVVTAAANAAPNKPAEAATQSAETQTVNATNALMRRINAITNANNTNNIINSNNFKGLSANNQGKVRNYSREKFPLYLVPVTGTRGTTISLVKNSPNAQWRFRKANANKGYVLTNANKNTPKVYYSANFVPK
jgi:hypothetical protein